MEQASFNSIQGNFKKFLSNKLHPASVIQEKKEPIQSSSNLNQRVERIERTNAFGREDCEIGYKISFTDKNGNKKTQMVGL